jgi:hypothetical protein
MVDQTWAGILQTVKGVRLKRVEHFLHVSFHRGVGNAKTAAYLQNPHTAQLFLGHTNLESSASCLGREVDAAVETAEQTEV